MKYVYPRKKTDGTPFWTVRPPRIVLRYSDLTTQSFDSEAEANEYAKSVASVRESLVAAHKREADAKAVKDGTVAALVAEYRNSPSYKSKSPNTRRSYDFYIDLLLKFRPEKSPITMGQMIARNLTAAHADAFYTHAFTHNGPAMAAQSCKIARKIWNHGYRRNLVGNNVWSKMGIPSGEKRDVLWSDDWFNTYVVECDRLGHIGMGTLTILCHQLCQRPGDMRQLKWSNYKNGEFTFIQEKTRTPLILPDTEMIKDRLEKYHPRGEPEATIITKKDGQPFQASHVTSLHYRMREKIGMPTHIQIRDLRRTGATELGNSGVSDRHLMSVTGHRNVHELNTYVVQNAVMAEQAMKKRFGDTEITPELLDEFAQFVKIRDMMK